MNIASTWDIASRDIRLLITRPSSSCGVSCCSKVCEVTMMNAAEKPKASIPTAVEATRLKMAVINIPKPMPPRP